MRILLTGSKGQLGLELTKKLSDYDLILTTRKTLDITNIDSVMRIIKAKKPNIIINCAAHTDVDLCETDIDNAYKINAIGAKNLAIASNEIGAKIVHISTDYVFDGESKMHYNEFDVANPQTIYGKTKLEGEKFVTAFCNNYFIIRTAWLYGEGDNFVSTMLELSQCARLLEVVNDQYGNPTSTAQLSNMIKHIMHTENYGLFHGTCEGSCTWYEFAKKIFGFVNTFVNLLPITTEEFIRPAKRPKYSVLDNYMLKLTSDFTFSTWQEALSDYMLSEGIK